MKTIGVIANLEKTGARELLEEIATKGEEKGLQLVFDRSCSEPGHTGSREGRDEFFEGVDCVLTLGGDGTLLGAVRRMGGRPVPLLGINFGKLGFLTSVTREQLDEVLDALANDTCIPSRRGLIECTYANPGEAPRRELAMNDVVLSWGKSSHIASLEVSVNGEEVTTYTCDGLIAATPTGSTGHSLSAGGPILTPDSHAMVLSPICPHAMTVRPVVLSFQTELVIRLTPQSKALVLACDGQPLQELAPGGEVRTRPADVTVELLHLPGYAYWEALRSKLHWRGSSINH